MMMCPYNNAHFQVYVFAPEGLPLWRCCCCGTRHEVKSLLPCMTLGAGFKLFTVAATLYADPAMAVASQAAIAARMAQITAIIPDAMFVLRVYATFETPLHCAACRSTCI